MCGADLADMYTLRYTWYYETCNGYTAEWSLPVAYAAAADGLTGTVAGGSLAASVPGHGKRVAAGISPE